MIVREITYIRINKEVILSHQGRGFDGQIGAWRDPSKIGDLTDNRFLGI